MKQHHDLERKTIPAALLTYEERDFLSNILQNPNPEEKEIQELKESFDRVTYVEITGVITPTVMSTLAAALHGNRTIKTLVFNEPVADAAMRRFCELFLNLTCIQNIEFRLLNIGQETMDELVNFQRNSTVTSVNLGLNLQSSKDLLLPIATSLPSDQQLKSLHLTLEDKRSDGITQIAEALHDNNSLAFIELNVRRIYLDELIAIFEALYFNHGLKSIIIHHQHASTFNPAIASDRILINLYQIIKLLTDINRTGQEKPVHPVSSVIERSTLMPRVISDLVTRYLPWKERHYAYNEKPSDEKTAMPGKK